MFFQYTYDADGKPVNVFVPIAEWEKITNESKRKKQPAELLHPKKSFQKNIPL